MWMNALRWMNAVWMMGYELYIFEESWEENRCEWMHYDEWMLYEWWAMNYIYNWRIMRGLCELKIDVKWTLIGQGQNGYTLYKIPPYYIKKFIPAKISQKIIYSIHKYKS